jgi:hypothetical protein
MVPRCGSCTKARMAAQVATIIARGEVVALSSLQEVPQGASHAASVQILPQHAQALPGQCAVSLADAQIAVGLHSSFLCSSYVHLLSLRCRSRASRGTAR